MTPPNPGDAPKYRALRVNVPPNGYGIEWPGPDAPLGPWVSPELLKAYEELAEAARANCEWVTPSQADVERVEKALARVSALKEQK